MFCDKMCKKNKKAIYTYMCNLYKLILKSYVYKYLYKKSCQKKMIRRNSTSVIQQANNMCDRRNDRSN